MPHHLILIPTVMEQQKLLPHLEPLIEKYDLVIEVCGFGPIAAAAVTTQKIIHHNPQQVVLIGIAGGFAGDASIEPGCACRFSSVTLDGIGAGEGDTFQSAAQMGWAQLQSSDQKGSSDLIPIGTAAHQQPPHKLLTACAASGDASHAQRRRARFGADAEDMEGFGVALACQLTQTPLHILRGISNMAGDRNHAHWKIDEALAAAADLLRQTLEETNPQ